MNNEKEVVNCDHCIKELEEEFIFFSDGRLDFCSKECFLNSEEYKSGEISLPDKGKEKKTEFLKDNNDFSSLQITNFNENKELIIKTFTDRIEKEICQVEIDYSRTEFGLVNEVVESIPIVSNLVSVYQSINTKINARKEVISDRKSLMIRNKVVAKLENTVNDLGVILVNTVDMIKKQYEEESEAYKREIFKLNTKVEELEDLFNSNRISDNDKFDKLLGKNSAIKGIIDSTDLNINPNRHLTTEQEAILALMLNLKSTTTQLKLTEIENRNLKISNDDWGNAYLDWKEKEKKLLGLKLKLELALSRANAEIKDLTGNVERLEERPFIYKYLPDFYSFTDNIIWSIAIGFLALLNLIALIRSIEVFILTMLSSSVLIGLKLFLPSKGNQWIFKTTFYSYISLAVFILLGKWIKDNWNKIVKSDSKAKDDKELEIKTEESLSNKE